MSPPPPEIVVVGSLNMDLIARVSRLPAAGETVLGTEMRTAPGGKGGNQAVAAARFGARTHMIGCVGPDAYGGELKAALERERVDVAGVHTLEAQTGVALILVDDQGQNQIAAIPGANGQLTADMIDSSVWTSSTWVVAQLEVSIEAVHAAFTLAGSGARTILNAAPARQIPADVWALTRVLVVNETEAAVLSGRPLDDLASTVAVARELSRLGPETVAVTLGANGAVIVAEGDPWHVPAFPVTAVDATAAGDAWVGTLAASLAEGVKLMDAAVAASVAGALAATRPGAQPSLPYLSEAMEHMTRAPAPRRLA